MKQRYAFKSVRPALLAYICVVGFNAATTLASESGKMGVMGDSIAAATHSSQTCGNNDIVDCLENELGKHSRDWSYIAGNKSWSLASLLGYSSNSLVDASDDGEEWKDALNQARVIMADPNVEAVVIGLGANDVCKPYGHDYANDLETIEAHIDATLGFLTDTLPPHGQIFWSGVPDIVAFRNMMVERDHNYLFKSCQATWDLDDEEIKDEAAQDACDHFFDRRLCEALNNVEQAQDSLMDIVTDRWLEMEGVEEGPCGKVLDSRSTNQDREDARQFNQALNQLMAQKAEVYNGRNGISVHYTSAIFSASQTVRPYHISRLDCYHPNRTGQMKLASEIWQGLNLSHGVKRKIRFDEFDSQDYCTQEFTNWETCWMEIGEMCGPTACDIQTQNQELRVQNRNKGIWRGLNLDGMEEAWISVNWRRDSLDDGDEYVTFDVSPDGGENWHRLDRFRGDGDDFNMHRSRYFDLTPYATAHTRIRFLSSDDLGSSDRVYFDNVKVMGWRDPGSTPAPIIEANSSLGPVTIAEGSPLQITVGLDSRDERSADADFWILAITPSGNYWFTLDRGWLRSDTPITAHQGALFDFSAYEVLNYSGLTKGSYVFYMGVDLRMNGSLDTDPLYYDGVSVTIQ